MCAFVSEPASRATNGHDKSDAETTNLRSDDSEWFSDAAQRLLAPKPGTALHYATGFDERSCQRYAAGTVKPPAYFLRALLRSGQGWVWLSALMDGSDVQWWRDVQRAQKIAAALGKIE